MHWERVGHGRPVALSALRPLATPSYTIIDHTRASFEAATAIGRTFISDTDPSTNTMSRSTADHDDDDEEWPTAEETLEENSEAEDL